MDRDLKEIVGTIMRVLNGEAVSRREVENLEFEATGELQMALNEAFLLLLEYAYDCENSPHACNGELREELHKSLDDIVRLAEASRSPNRRSTGESFPSLGAS